MYIHNIFYTKITPPLETEVEGQTVNFPCSLFKGEGGITYLFFIFFVRFPYAGNFCCCFSKGEGR